MRLDAHITGNDEVQRLVASEREKRALLAVSPMARKAIKLEVLPQIEESVLSVESAESLCADTKRAIEAAFSYKNPLYTRLISHKGIEQSDSQYLRDLLLVMDEWLRNTRASLERGSKKERPEAGESDKQEVEVTVKVEAKPEPEPEVQLATEPELRLEFEPDASPDTGQVELGSEPELRFDLEPEGDDAPWDDIVVQPADEGPRFDLDTEDIFDLLDMGL